MWEYRDWQARRARRERRIMVGLLVMPAAAVLIALIAQLLWRLCNS